ncbi:unnamed protein product [Penicillium glandicola]
MDHLSVPTNKDLLRVLREIRSGNPHLGRPKILQRLRNEHHLRVSETRLKKLLAKHGLQRSDPEIRKLIDSELAPITYPQDALAAQQKYKDESTRCFKIYSRGAHDFGIAPNAEMALKMDVSHQRLKNVGRPKTPQDRLAMAIAWPMKCLFDYYWAAAQIAGVSKEDIGHQLEAEYGVNPVPFLPSRPNTAEIEARKSAHKTATLKMFRRILKLPEGQKYISVDVCGKPVWDEAKNGELCVLVGKIDKGSSLQEFALA